MVESVFEARGKAMRTRHVKKWTERQDLCASIAIEDSSTTSFKAD